MWKAAFSGRSEAGGSASGRSSSQKKIKSSGSVVSTTSRDERRKSGGGGGGSGRASHSSAYDDYYNDDLPTPSSRSGEPRGLTESAVQALSRDNDDDDLDWEDEDKDARSERRSVKSHKSGRSERHRRKSERSRSRSREKGRKEEKKKSSRRESEKGKSRSEDDYGKTRSDDAYGRTRSDDPNGKTRRDDAYGKRRSEDAYGKRRSEDASDREDERALPNMGSFQQFPGQYAGGMMGPAGQPDHMMSGGLSGGPPQAPDQQFGAPTREDSYGAAATYYLDEGQSVQHQPGVRAKSPNMLVNPDHHLHAASVDAQPAQDTGNGAAAEFFSGNTHMTEEPQPISKPGKKPAKQTSSSSKPSKSGRTSSLGTAAAATAAVGMAGAAASSHQKSSSTSNSYPQPQYSESPRPNRLGRQNSDQVSLGSGTPQYSSPQQNQGLNGSYYGPPPGQQGFGTPAKQGQNGVLYGSSQGTPTRPNADGTYYASPQGRQSEGKTGKSSSQKPNIGTYAAGAAAAGLAGYAAHEAHEHHKQKHSQSQHGASQYGGTQYGGTQYSRPPGYAPSAAYTSGSYAGMQQQRPFHEHKGPMTKFKDGFLNLLSTEEDVVKMEAYTEAIGVCKYCFDPRTSPWDAPRRHHYHSHSPRRDSFEDLRRRRSLDKMRKHGSRENLNGRVDKDSRYYASDSKRKSGSKSDLAAAGLAGVGLTAGANALFNSGKDFEDTYSVKSGHRAGSAARRRSRSSSREQRRKTSHGVIGRDSKDEYVFVRTKDGRTEKRRVRRSRSRSNDRKSGLMGAAAGAGLGALGAAAVAGARRRDSSSSRSRSNSPGLADIFGFGGQKPKRGRRSPRGSFGGASSRPGYGRQQSPGMFGGFFSSSPKRRNSQREHRKKKAGFFNFSNGSSSSSDGGMAFGDAFSSKTSLPLSRKSSNRNVKRRGSDQRLAATIAGIGTTAAALAAAQKGHRVSKRTSRTELGSRKKHVAPKDPSDEEWEDELPSDASSGSSLAFGDYNNRLSRRQSKESMASNGSGTGGLGAWGWRWGGKKERQKRRVPSPPPAYPPRPDTSVIAPAAAAGAAAVAGQDAPRPTYDSRGSSMSGSSRPPMQFVDPRPVSEESGSNRTSMPGSWDADEEPPVIRPGPAPLQQPKPVAPIQPAFTSRESEEAFDRPKPRRTMSSPVQKSFGMKDAAMIGAAALGSAGIIASQSGRRSKEPKDVRFGLTEEQQAKEDREKRKQRDKAERNEIARLDRERALKEEAERHTREQDVLRRREEENRRAAEARVEEERRAERERERQKEAEAQREQERQDSIRREEARKAEETQRQEDTRKRREAEIDAELEAKRRELDEEQRHSQQRRSSQSSKKSERSSSIPWGAVAAGTAAAATAGAAYSAIEHEREQDRKDASYTSREIAPGKTSPELAEADVFDPEFFKRKRSPNRSPSGDRQIEEIARKAYERIRQDEGHEDYYDRMIAEKEDYYHEPARSQADVFAPTEILERKPGYKEHAPDPIGDNDVRFVRDAQGHLFDEDLYGPKSFERSRHAPFGVPKLGLIAPTPPPDVSRAKQNEGRRRGQSPLRKSETPNRERTDRKSEEPPRSAKSEVGFSGSEREARDDRDTRSEPGGKRERSRSITWGEPQTHVYEPRTPESFRENADGFFDAKDIGIGAAAAAAAGAGAAAMYGSSDHADDKRSDREKAFDAAAADEYRKPFFESVSDLGFKADSPGTEGAPPVRGFVEGEVESTPKEEKRQHIPGGWDDEQRDGDFFDAQDTQGPGDAALGAKSKVDEPAWEPPLSKKDKKKKEKAAKRAAAFDEDMSAPPPPPPAPEPEPTIQQPEAPVEEEVPYEMLSKKDKKKRDKAKRASMLEEDIASSAAPEPQPEVAPVESTPASVEDEIPYELLSKKDKKKRDKLKRSMSEDIGSPPPEPESEVVQEPAQPAEKEEVPYELLSKKDKKKRDKAKRASMLEDDVASPPIESQAEPTPVSAEPEPEWEPPLSKKEQKKRDKEAKKQGFADVATAAMTTAGIAAVAGAAAEEEDDAWDAPSSGKKSKKGKKANTIDRDLRDIEPSADAMPGSWEAEKTTDSPPPEAVDPFQYQVRDNSPPAATPSPDAAKEVDPMDEFAEVKGSKKSKKKAKRDSLRFNEPEVSSPLRAEVAFDDYVGALQARSGAEASTNGHAEEQQKPVDGEERLPRSTKYEVDDRPLTESPRRISPDDARSVASEPTGARERRRKSKGESRASEYYEEGETDPYDDVRSVAASEPADIYERRKSKRRSRTDDDDTASVVSSRSRKERDEEPKREKKSGFFGLFGKKSSPPPSSSRSEPGASLSRTSTRESKDGYDDERSERRHRRHRSEYADDDNAYDDVRSVVSESRPRHHHRRRTDEEFSRPTSESGSQHHHRRRTDDDYFSERRSSSKDEYNDRDQSFLGKRVEDLPPLPDKRPGYSAARESRGFGTPGSAEAIRAGEGDERGFHEPGETAQADEQLKDGAKERDEALRKLSGEDDLPPLPASLPGSPTDIAQTPHRPLPLQRPTSTTSVPLRFPFGQSPSTPGHGRIERATSFGGYLPSSPSSPHTTSGSHAKPRPGRPTSTEFRPLYLVESTRKPEAVEEGLPSLPSSKPSSRASSVNGSDEYESAVEEFSSPVRAWQRGLAIDTEGANASAGFANTGEDYLDSQQTTPRASERPSNPFDAAAASASTIKGPKRQPEFWTWEDLQREETFEREKEGRPQPQFYTWEDYERDEALHRGVDDGGDERDLPALPPSRPESRTEAQSESGDAAKGVAAAAGAALVGGAAVLGYDALKDRKEEDGLPDKEPEQPAPSTKKQKKKGKKGKKTSAFEEPSNEQQTVEAPPSEAKRDVDVAAPAQDAPLSSPTDAEFFEAVDQQSHEKPKGLPPMSGMVAAGSVAPIATGDETSSARDLDASQIEPSPSSTHQRRSLSDATAQTESHLPHLEKQPSSGHEEDMVAIPAAVEASTSVDMDAQPEAEFAPLVSRKQSKKGKKQAKRGSDAKTALDEVLASDAAQEPAASAPAPPEPAGEAGSGDAVGVGREGVASTAVEGGDDWSSQPSVSRKQSKKQKKKQQKQQQQFDGFGDEQPEEAGETTAGPPADAALTADDSARALDDTAAEQDTSTLPIAETTSDVERDLAEAPATGEADRATEEQAARAVLGDAKAPENDDQAQQSGVPSAIVESALESDEPAESGLDQQPPAAETEDEFAFPTSASKKKDKKKAKKAKKTAASEALPWDEEPSAVSEAPAVDAQDSGPAAETDVGRSDPSPAVPVDQEPAARDLTSIDELAGLAPDALPISDEATRSTEPDPGPSKQDDATPMPELEQAVPSGDAVNGDDFWEPTSKKKSKKGKKAATMSAEEDKSVEPDATEPSGVVVEQPETEAAAETSRDIDVATPTAAEEPDDFWAPTSSKKKGKKAKKAAKTAGAMLDFGDDQTADTLAHETPAEVQETPVDTAEQPLEPSAEPAEQTPTAVEADDFFAPVSSKKKKGKKGKKSGLETPIETEADVEPVVEHTAAPALAEATPVDETPSAVAVEEYRRIPSDTAALETQDNVAETQNSTAPEEPTVGEIESTPKPADEQQPVDVAEPELAETASREPAVEDDEWALPVKKKKGKKGKKALAELAFAPMEDIDAPATMDQSREASVLPAESADQARDAQAVVEEDEWAPTTLKKKKKGKKAKKSEPEPGPSEAIPEAGVAQGDDRVAASAPLDAATKVSMPADAELAAKREVDLNLDQEEPRENSEVSPEAAAESAAADAQDMPAAVDDTARAQKTPAVDEDAFLAAPSKKQKKKDKKNKAREQSSMPGSFFGDETLPGPDDGSATPAAESAEPSQPEPRTKEFVPTTAEKSAEEATMPGEAGVQPSQPDLSVDESEVATAEKAMGASTAPAEEIVEASLPERSAEQSEFAVENNAVESSATPAQESADPEQLASAEGEDMWNFSTTKKKKGKKGKRSELAAPEASSVEVQQPELDVAKGLPTGSDASEAAVQESSADAAIESTKLPESVGTEPVAAEADTQAGDDFWAAPTKKKKGKKGKKAAPEPEAFQPEETAEPGLPFQEPAADVRNVHSEVPGAGDEAVSAPLANADGPPTAETSDEFWAAPTKKKKKGKKGKKGQADAAQFDLLDAGAGDSSLNDSEPTMTGESTEKPMPDVESKKVPESATDLGDDTLEGSSRDVNADPKFDESGCPVPSEPTETLMPDVDSKNAPHAVRDLAQDTTEAPAVDIDAEPASALAGEPGDDFWAMPSKSKKKGKKGKKSLAEPEVAELASQEPAVQTEETISPAPATETATEPASEATKAWAEADEAFWAAPSKKRKGKTAKKAGTQAPLESIEPETAASAPEAGMFEPSAMESQASEQVPAENTREMHPVETHRAPEIPADATDDPAVATDFNEFALPSGSADKPLDPEGSSQDGQESKVQDQIANATGDLADTQQQGTMAVGDQAEPAPGETFTESRKQKDEVGPAAAGGDAKVASEMSREVPMEDVSAETTKSIDRDVAANEISLQEPNEDADSFWALPSKKKKKGKKGKQAANPITDQDVETAAQDYTPANAANEPMTETADRTAEDSTAPFSGPTDAAPQDGDDFWSAPAKGKKGKKAKKGKRATFDFTDAPEPGNTESQGADQAETSNITARDQDGTYQVAEPAGRQIAAETALEEPTPSVPEPTMAAEQTTDAKVSDPPFPSADDEQAEDAMSSENAPPSQESWNETAPVQASAQDISLEESGAPMEGVQAESEATQHPKASAEPAHAQNESTEDADFELLTKKSKKDKKKAKKAKQSADSWSEEPEDSVPTSAAIEAAVGKDGADIAASTEAAGAAGALTDDMPESANDISVREMIDSITDETSVQPSNETAGQAEEEWPTFSAKKSKKDKKKAKKADADARAQDAASAFDESTGLAAAAAAPTTAAAVGAATALDDGDEKPSEQPEEEWPTFSTKKSKKDRKKAKKAEASALEMNAEPEANQTFSEPMDVDQGGDRSIDNADPDSALVPTPSMAPNRGGDEIVSELTHEPRESDNPWHSETNVTDAREPETTALGQDDPNQRGDIDFAATVAAGLQDSGFNPDMVVNDPVFHRRATPPGATGEADPGEVFESFSKKKKKKGKKGKQAEATSEEPAKNASGDQTPQNATDDFNEVLAKSLEGTGIDASALDQNVDVQTDRSADDLTGDSADFSFSTARRKTDKKKSRAAEPHDAWNVTADEPQDRGQPMDQTDVEQVHSVEEAPLEVGDESRPELARQLTVDTSTTEPSSAFTTTPGTPLHDHAADLIHAGERDMDVDDMDKAYREYKRNKRKQKKQKWAALQAEEAAKETAPSGESTDPADTSLANATPNDAERAVSGQQDAENIEQTDFVPSGEADRQGSLQPDNTNQGPSDYVHTSKVSQSLPAAFERTPSPSLRLQTEHTPDAEHERSISGAEAVGLGATAAAAAVGAEALAARSPSRHRDRSPNTPRLESKRSLGLLPHDNEPSWSFGRMGDEAETSNNAGPAKHERNVVRDSGYQSGHGLNRGIPEIRSTKSKESLHSRRSNEALYISTDTGPEWDLKTPKKRSTANASTDESGTLHARTPSQSTQDTPLEPTSRNRASYLFQTTPENLRNAGQGADNTPTQEYFPADGEESSRGRERSFSNPDRGALSPPPAGVMSPRIPLDTIPEEHLAHKRSMGDAAEGLGPDHKSVRRTETPQSIRARERVLSPSGLPALQTASTSGRSVSNPGVDELARTSDVRSPSVMSNRSHASVHQWKSPDELRSYSRASNRSNTPSLRRTSLSGDLRAASRRGDTESSVGARSSPKTIPFEAPPTPPLNDDEVMDAGASRSAAMSDVYQGYGDAQGSQVSPTRPPSMRKRQSMHIMDLESKLEHLAAENQALQSARQENGSSRGLDGQSLEEALRARDLEVQQKDNEINQIRAMLQPMQDEIARLTEMNDGLTEANRNLVDDSNGRYSSLQQEHAQAHEQWQTASRELDGLRQEHGQLTSGLRAAVEAELATALASKNSEIRELREELDEATEKIRALQSQIQSTKGRDFLTVRDEDYFDGACQKLCQHVQQWVLRFSKTSDKHICRLSTELKDDKIEARLDNAILDGSDVDKLLGDRVRRRDVFMSVVMTMVWEYVFTRYLFGMDREQRQKLKTLEKLLAEVGPPRAVAQWRATTLTLLAKRPAFSEQRNRDEEAVASEIFDLLCTLLPPPSGNKEALLSSLQRVVHIAVDLSIEMRTQRSEYIMLPPLLPEYDTNGDLMHKVHFNASLMNERSGMFSSNEELEQSRAVVKIVLFPLVVKKGDEVGEGEEEIVVCPAQVLVHNENNRGKKVVRVESGHMTIDDPRRSRQSLVSGAGSNAF